MLASTKHKIKILVVTTFSPSILFPLLLHFFVIVLCVSVWVSFVCLFCFFERSYYVSPLDLELTVWIKLSSASRELDYRCESLIQSSDVTSHDFKSREK